MSNKSTQKERKQEKEKKIICLLVLPDKEQMLCTRSQSETFTLYTLRSKCSVLTHNRKLSHYTPSGAKMWNTVPIHLRFGCKKPHTKHMHTKTTATEYVLWRNHLVRKKTTTTNKQTKFINELGYKRNSLDTTLLSINCIQQNTKLSQFKNTEKLQMFLKLQAHVCLSQVSSMSESEVTAQQLVQSASNPAKAATRGRTPSGDWVKGLDSISPCHVNSSASLWRYQCRSHFCVYGNTQSLSAILN